MKRIFGLITICSILALPVLAAKPVVSNPIDHPLPATDVHLVKKVPLPPEIGELKGRPQGGPPGQNKDKNGGPEEAAKGVLGEPLPAGASKYAIVIGICNYPGTRNDIGDCISDGDSLNMYKTLIERGYDPTNIHLFKDGGGTTHFSNIPEIPDITAEIPTKSSILGAIKSLNPSSDDEIVFFFSGHGADGLVGDGDSERRDEGIVVYKDNASDLDSDYAIIWDGELKTAFSNFTNRIVFVFDSCLAGGMDDVAKTGRVVAMGTSETQVGYVFSTGTEPDAPDFDEDGWPDGEGVFTHYFINEGTLLGKADKYNHSTSDPSDEPEIQNPNDVVIEEAFDYAKGIIPSVWKRQNPTISDGFDDDLLLGY